MKKYVMTAAATIIAAALSAQSDRQLHLVAQLQDFGDTIVVNKSSNDDKVFVGKDGHFDFILDIEEPQYVACSTPYTTPRDKARNFNFFAMPGETVRITGNVKDDLHVSGSKFYEQMNMMPAGQMDTLAIESYVKNHNDEDAAVLVIMKQSNPIRMKKLYAMFTPAVQEGRMKPFFDKMYARNLRIFTRLEEARKVQAPGNVLPDFTLNDINGKPLTLSSLRGKHVILDFWGSWCGWCLKGMPKMKEYYEKYKGRFEIIGVDCKDTEEKWKAAVEKNKIPWLHVFVPKDSDLLKRYAIQSYPTKILIGPDGRIIKSIIGESQSFYDLLDEIFANIK